MAGNDIFRLDILRAVMVLMLSLSVSSSTLASGHSDAMSFFLWSSQLPSSIDPTSLFLPSNQSFTNAVQSIQSHHTKKGDHSTRACDDLVTLYLSTKGGDRDKLMAQCKELRLCRHRSQVEPTSNLESGQDTLRSLDNVCPTLMTMIGNDHCASSPVQTGTKPSRTLTWIYTMGTVAIISISSIAGALIFPCFAKRPVAYKQLINTFTGLAVGSLLSSAVFHLLPQAFKLNETTSHHEYLSVSMSSCLGIYLFYWVDQIMYIYRKFSKKQSKKKIADSDCITSNGGTDHKMVPMVQMSKEEVDPEGGDEHGHGHSHTIERTIASVAWMVIFSDGIHNFIDGLSIGAAFGENTTAGFSIALACLFEELPHELGDFAVLLNSGFSMKESIAWNFLSACTCFLGAIFGILFGDLGPTYIFGLAAGMFLYISLVNLTSELKDYLEDTSSMAEFVFTLLLQNLGILFGVFFLYFLALNPDMFTMIL